MEKYKKIILTAIAAAVVLGFSSGQSYAQNASNVAPKKPIPTQNKGQTPKVINATTSEARNKINQIKDEKKRDAANKIADKINAVNQGWTNHFKNVLDRLDAILAKIKSRSTKAYEAGKNVSRVNAAIQKAEDAIFEARSAVAFQAAKVYSINPSDITQDASTANGQNSLVNDLRSKFKLLRSQLFEDLFSLRDGAMKNARNAVQDAFRQLAEDSGS